MCISFDMDDEPGASSFAWGQFTGALSSHGGIGGLAADLLEGAGAGNNSWGGVASSDKMQLNFESGATMVVDADDLDPKLLASYGYINDPDSGVLPTGDPGVPSDPGNPDALPPGLARAAWAMTPDGQLVPQPDEVALPPGVLPPGAWVSSGPVGAPLFELDPTLAPEDQIWTNIVPPDVPAPPTYQDIKDMLASIPDERIATTDPPGTYRDDSGLLRYQEDGSVVPNQVWVPANPGWTDSNGQWHPGMEGPGMEMGGGRYVLITSDAVSTTPAQATPFPAQPSFLSTLQSAYGGAVPPPPPPQAADSLLFVQLYDMYGGAPPGGPAGGALSTYDPGALYSPGDIVGWPPEADNPDVLTPSDTPGIFHNQGLFVDGRVLPNIFKVMNQDIWAAWGKESGSEAALTFLFVMAMNGALALPQFVNDIPNIPTLLATAMDEADQGNWGKGLAAFGDAAGAFGMLGELISGAAALSEVSEAVGAGSGKGGALRDGLQSVAASGTESGGVNLCAEGDNYGEYASRATGWSSGHFDVVVHGGPDGFFTLAVDGERISLDAVVEAVRSSPDYAAGQPIRLLSCQTAADGGIPAQALADALGVQVVAPTTNVIACSNGGFELAATETGELGQWIPFEAGGG
jgi:hypothetical protein